MCKVGVKIHTSVLCNVYSAVSVNTGQNGDKSDRRQGDKTAPT